MAQEEACRLHQVAVRVGERPHVFVPLGGESIVRIHRDAQVGKHPRPVRGDADVGIGMLADKKTDNRLGGGMVAEPSDCRDKDASGRIFNSRIYNFQVVFVFFI